MRTLYGLLIVIAATCLSAAGMYSFGQEPEPSVTRQKEVQLTAKAQRSDTRIEVTIDQEAALLEVHCPRGIDRAILTRHGERWPESIRLRLHLKGLESFKAAAGQTAVEWAASRTGQSDSRVTLWQAGGETAIDRDSPYFTEVRVEEGYFEVALPARLIEANPLELELQWIDFYRN